MKQFFISPIGRIRVCEEGMFVEVYKAYIPALKELDGFRHVNVLCWFDKCDNKEARSFLQAPAPYKNAPDAMGIFATRSPARPNPIALSACEVINIDHEKGLIQIGYIDADEDTPVIDLKPYTPSLDRVESPGVPKWCGHWPKSLEKSGEFDWENEFTF